VATAIASNGTACIDPADSRPTGAVVGNQREIRQVSPRHGLGVVIPVVTRRIVEVKQLLGDDAEQCRFYTYFCPAGEPIHIANLDGPDIQLPAQARDHITIQSGGKMWCGYEEFVARVRSLAPHLGNTLFFVGDELDYIDEFRLSDGQLLYRRVVQGYWWPVDDYIRSRGLAEDASRRDEANPELSDSGDADRLA
jgi:hypothetical protein